MSIDDLIQWHTIAMWSATDDELIGIHRDAIETLKWCIELPAWGPGQYGREASFARLLEATNEMLARNAEAVLAEEEMGPPDPDDDSLTADKRFWLSVNSAVAERIWPVAKE